MDLQALKPQFSNPTVSSVRHYLHMASPCGVEVGTGLPKVQASARAEPPGIIGAQNIISNLTGLRSSFWHEETRSAYN